MSESELDDLMGEVGGPCNVMGMVNMFQEKLAGDGNAPDEEAPAEDEDGDAKKKKKKKKKAAK